MGVVVGVGHSLHCSRLLFTNCPLARASTETHKNTHMSPPLPLTLSSAFQPAVRRMGKSESQMDIMEKSSKPGKHRWTVAEIGLSVLLLLVSCALAGLVVLYTSAVKGKTIKNRRKHSTAANCTEVIFCFSIIGYYPCA